MADTPEAYKTGSPMPYIWAAIIVMLIGVIFVGMVLYLRPQLDPLLVITPAMGLMATVIAAVAGFIKNQETHRTVNSELSGWKKDNTALRLAEGEIIGAQKEQERVAEQKRISALTAPVAAAIPAAPVAPVPVVVENKEAVPVVVHDKPAPPA